MVRIYEPGIGHNMLRNRWDQIGIDVMAHSRQYDALSLDAMGVIYSVGDDVGELLVPFIRRHGGTTDVTAIERAYNLVSLGKLSAEAFWLSVEVDPALEDKYISEHSLSAGIHELLDFAVKAFPVVCCLSNGIAQWSIKLRRHFDLEGHISPWIVGGDFGLRKPDRQIYLKMIDVLGVPPERILFVDDRLANVDAARDVGLGTILLSDKPLAGSQHRVARSLIELINVI
jgi:HAD superfamily hydrolase (TIGR01509 family)